MKTRKITVFGVQNPLSSVGEEIHFVLFAQSPEGEKGFWHENSVFSVIFGVFADFSVIFGDLETEYLVAYLSAHQKVSKWVTFWTTF